MKKGQEPAFPSEEENIVIGQTPFSYTDDNGVAQTGYNNEFGKIVNLGISKRFYAACAAMQGLLSAYSGDKHLPSDNEIISSAYDLADELLKQENETDRG